MCMQTLWKVQAIAIYSSYIIKYECHMFKQDFDDIYTNLSSRAFSPSYDLNTEVSSFKGDEFQFFEPGKGLGETVFKVRKWPLWRWILPK